MKIRLAKQEDAEQLQDLYRRCVVEAEWQTRSAKNFPDFASLSIDETIWVWVNGDEQVRAVLAVQDSDAYVHHLYVHPEAQRQGLGAAMLLHLQSYMPFPWRLKCVANNQMALAFYRRLGWQVLERGASDDGDYFLLALKEANQAD